MSAEKITNYTSQGLGAKPAEHVIDASWTSGQLRMKADMAENRAKRLLAGGDNEGADEEMKWARTLIEEADYVEDYYFDEDDYSEPDMTDGDIYQARSGISGQESYAAAQEQDRAEEGSAADWDDGKL